ncbi:MAG: rhodanese-like domain-containing protein [Pseudomonadota bacterium]
MTQFLVELAPRALLEAMDAGEVLLVDVREEAEFAAVRIRGALNHPLSTFDPSALLAGADVSRVVLQCGSGKRSAMAAARCRAEGFAVDKHLAGGIQAWAAAGLPVTDVNAADDRPGDPD